MDSLNTYRDIIEKTLESLVDLSSSDSDVQLQPVFDRKHDHYLVAQVGWGRRERIYGIVGHLDLIEGKIWIQVDGTEDGISEKLLEAGIPREHIVLGFRIPEIRQHTGFAVV